MAEHLFLTGGTGFIGSRLLRLWLDRTEAQVTLLLRDRPRISPEIRLRRLLASYPADTRDALVARLRIVSGDLGRPGLGLTSPDLDAIADTVTHIVHAGAELRFDLPLERARRTNTAGTSEIVGLARRCRRLERLDYVGTAYVAGRSAGVVLEEARNGDVEHNNTYERSKYEAELLVREAMAKVPATVLRPSIVTCDLATGYTPPTSAFYRLLRGVATRDLERLPGREDTLLDLVPVDFVTAAAFAIGRNPGCAGRCFHLTAGVDNRISVGRLRDLACQGFQRERLAILPPAEFTRWANGVRRKDPERSALVDELALYLPYLSDHPLFDDANTRRALAELDVRVSPVADYFDRVAAYIASTLPGGDRGPERPHFA